jgi:hypothetical protein
LFTAGRCALGAGVTVFAVAPSSAGPELLQVRILNRWTTIRARGTVALSIAESARTVLSQNIPDLMADVPVTAYYAPGMGRVLFGLLVLLLCPSRD